MAVITEEMVDIGLVDMGVFPAAESLELLSAAELHLHGLIWDPSLAVDHFGGKPADMVHHQFGCFNFNVEAGQVVAFNSNSFFQKTITPITPEILEALERSDLTR